MAHTCQSFDMRVLLHAVSGEDLSECFQAVVGSFSDFLLAIKSTKPGLRRYSLSALHQALLGKGFPAHNAVHDVDV